MMPVVITDRGPCYSRIISRIECIPAIIYHYFEFISSCHKQPTRETPLVINKQEYNSTLLGVYSFLGQFEASDCVFSNTALFKHVKLTILVLLTSLAIHQKELDFFFMCVNVSFIIRQRSKQGRFSTAKVNTLHTKSIHRH